MTSSLRQHSIIALFSLGLAWLAWTRAPDGAPDGPQVLDFDPDSLSRIGWQSDQHTLTLTREAGQKGQVRLILAAKGPPETWPGSDAAEDIFHDLAQVRALRRLPTPDAAQRQAWQLGEEAACLTLVGSARGRPAQVSLRVGVGTYGEHDFVVEREAGEIFLLARQHLSALVQPLRLQAREAVSLRHDEVERIGLQLGEVRRDLRLQRGDNSAQDTALSAWWVDDAQPGHRLLTADPWLSHCLQLRVVRLLPELPSSPPALELELGGPGGRAARLQMWPPGPQGAPARSSRFDAPVLLHPGAAEAVLKDAQAVAWEGKISGQEAAPRGGP